MFETDASDADQLSLEKQTVDQSLHIIACLIILAPLLLFPALWTAALTGLFIGILREVSQHSGKITLASFNFRLWSCVDILFWGIGGGIAWLVFALINS